MEILVKFLGLGFEYLGKVMSGEMDGDEAMSKLLAKGEEFRKGSDQAARDVAPTEKDDG